MATRKLKSNGTVKQLNINDTAGELVQSFNIDLKDNIGKIKLARPMKRGATAAELSNDQIEGLVVLGSSAQNNTIYAITDSNLYSSNLSTIDFNAVSASPQAAEDATVFQGQMIISTTADLDAYNFISTYTSDWWTARGNPSLTSNSGGSEVPRVMDVARIGAETLVVLDGSSVHAYTGGITSGAISSVTMDIDDQLIATCFKSSIRRGFIGTYTYSADQAYVIEWDVASTDYTQAFPTGSRSVLAMELIDDVPLIINELGEIKLFNNAGFTTVATFPFHGSATFVDQSTNPNNKNRPIHPKGIKRQSDTLYINTNWKNADGSIDDLPIEKRTPNGIWTLDLKTYSLSHLCSPNNQSVFDGQHASPILVLNDYHSRIITGGDLGSDEGIWLEDLDPTVTNYGHFTTVEFESDSIEDSFNQVVVKSLMTSSDSIVVKYRYANDIALPVHFDGSWMNENTINTTDDMSYIKERFDAGHRDEMEIFNGHNSGRLAHITNIEASASTYQITVDEDLGSAGETSNVRVDNWIKVPDPITSADGEVKRIGISSVSSWVQLRFELRGKAGYPEIREIQLLANNKQGK